jgi:tetratricopeptide (TPR) repeat protein
MIRKILFLVVIAIFFAACKDGGGKKSGPVEIPADATIEQLNSLLLQYPDDTGLLFERAKYYADIGIFNSAIDDMNKLIGLEPRNPDHYHYLADLYMDSAQSRFAVFTMQKVIDMYPTRIQSLLKLSEIYFIIREYDNSIESINSILYLSPGNPEAYYMLGVNFKEINEYAKARNSFLTAVERDANHTDSWIQLGLLAEENKDEKAEIYYNNAIRSDTSSLEALHHLAFYYQEHNRMDDALEIYRQMGIKSPGNASSFYNSGLIYLKLDSLERAYENFTIVINTNRTNPRPYYYRGLVNFIIGDMEKAANDLEQALKLDPGFKEAEDKLKTIKAKKS